jgi:hypothetical protein
VTTLYNPLIDSDYYHNDDIKVVGPAKIRGQEIDRINLVTVDTESAARRNIGYIRENIAARKAREDNYAQRVC